MNVLKKTLKSQWFWTLLISLLVTFFVDDGSNIAIWKHFLVTYVFAVVLYNGTDIIMVRMRALIPPIDATGTRVLASFFVIIIFVFIVTSILYTLYVPIIDKGPWDIRKLFVDFEISLVVTVIIGAVFEAIYYFDLYKESLLLKERESTETLRLQFELLSKQMNPPVFFSNLHTLANLIKTQNENSQAFVESFAAVFRYILEMQNKAEVTLLEEMNFIKSYIFMLSFEYGDSLTFEYKIPEDCENRKIKPLTLRFLVDNVIKHNNISSIFPVKVRFYTEERQTFLGVENTYMPKSHVEKEKNASFNLLNAHFAVSKHTKLVMSQSEKLFVVYVPLF